jgi:hypothetical protein
LFVEILAQLPGNKPVKPLVIQSLNDVSRKIRSRALTALSENRGSLAIPYYVHGLRHKSNIIVRRSGSALGRFGDADVVPHLINALVTTHRYRVRVPDTSQTMSFGTDGSFGSRGALLPPNIELMLRTGQLPYGVVIDDPSSALPTKIITVRYDHQNSEVLAALRKITGTSHGFDQRSWRLWRASQKDNAAQPVPGSNS